MQLVSIKLLIDGVITLLVLLKRSSGAVELEGVAWIWGGLGMVALFLFVAVGAKQFAGSHSLKTEGKS